MSDRILSRCLWLLIMALIAASALGSLALLYVALFRMIGRNFESGGIALGTGLLLAVACWALCRHCDDLIDRDFHFRST